MGWGVRERAALRARCIEVWGYEPAAHGLRLRPPLGAVMLAAGISILTLALVQSIGVDTATSAPGGHIPVTICHRTGSATNPYVVITVDASAVDGQGANDHSGHPPRDGRNDIIPPPYGNPSAAELTILANGCRVPSSTTSPPTTAKPPGSTTTTAPSGTTTTTAPPATTSTTGPGVTTTTNPGVTVQTTTPPTTGDGSTTTTEPGGTTTTEPGGTTTTEPGGSTSTTVPVTGLSTPTTPIAVTSTAADPPGSLPFTGGDFVTLALAGLALSGWGTALLSRRSARADATR